MNRSALRLFTSSASLVLLVGTASAQSSRPLPHPIVTPQAFERAIESGTRTSSGSPGAEYWTNYAEYSIRASLSPDARQLTGTATILYHNNSPAGLTQLKLHLRQNLHAPGAIRNRRQEVTGGMHVAEVYLNGEPLVQHKAAGTYGYEISGTVMTITPLERVASGTSVEVEVSWAFTVPNKGAPRMGQDGEVFFLAYWYPQMAVFDDVSGWKAEVYRGSGEFYMGYADYDVEITLPEGWLVSATGTLTNADQVLSDRVNDRLQQAANSDDVVHVVLREERQAGLSTASVPGKMLNWRFEAENVRDFVFSASNAYIWDATRANVGDRYGDGSDDMALVHALYRPDAAAWNRSAEYLRYAIEDMSEKILPYPWPHMTAVEGLISGGMEYPMMTLIGGARTDASLFGVTYHEVAHMWFPMLVGSDEKSFVWLDEGLTEFNESVGKTEFLDVDGFSSARAFYYSLARSDSEVEMMRHGDLFPTTGSIRHVATYQKPALIFRSLVGMFGADRVYDALSEYARRWTYKHPQPYDFFNTFEDVLGEDLDWLWSPAFFDTWKSDVAIGSVSRGEDGSTEVVVEDRGLLPMPVVVAATFEGGEQQVQVIPVDAWLSGSVRERVVFSGGDVSRIELDPDMLLLDIDRSNNTWEMDE
jgi:hypothetical protein